MAKRVQLVRHDSAGLAAFTGLIGEVTVNTTDNTLAVHNGVTPGGFELALASLSNVSNATSLAAGKMSAAQVTELTAATAAIAVNAADIATNVADIISLDAALTVVEGFFTGVVLNLANGGTGSATAAGARTNLGLAIGTDVQAYDAVLTSWAAKTVPTGTVVGTTDTQTLTNKTLTAPVISSIVNTGTLTLPTSTDTLVGRATTDTLTNKTLTSPVISTIVNTGTLTLPTTTTTLVGRNTTDTLTNKTLTAPIISTIVNTGTLTLPTSTDTLVGRATTDTLTNKTLTSPVLNTGVSGTAIKDEDNMASNSATHLCTQQSIKAYVDSASGRALQEQYTLYTTQSSGATSLPYDNSIPQNTEGDEYITVAITPKFSTSILKVEAVVMCSASALASVTIALFRDSTAGALAVSTQSTPAASNMECLKLTYWVAAGSVSATTFKIRGGVSAGTFYINRTNASATLFGGSLVSFLSVTEYAA